MFVCRRALSLRSAPLSADCIASRVPSRRSVHNQITDDPNDQRQHDRSNDGRACEPLKFGRIKPTPRVPDQMPDAAERVMDQAPGVAKQNEPPDEASEEPLHV